MRTFGKFIIAALLALVATGCDAPQDSGEILTSHSLGVLSIDYQVQTDGAKAVRTRAQFVRYSAIEAHQVAQLLGLPLNLQTDLPQVGICKLYSTAATPVMEQLATGPHDVELLEAGELNVEAADRVVKLAPHHFPGVLPFISGVIYDQADTVESTGLGTVRISSPGGSVVGEFNVEAVAPTVPADLTTSSAVAGAPLAVSWKAEDDPVQALYIEIAQAPSNTTPSNSALRCRVSDNGQFDVPATAIHTLLQNHQPEQNTALNLSLIRVKSSKIQVAGLEQVELRVSVSSQLSVAVQ